MSSLTAKEPSNTNQTFLLEQMMPIIMTHLGGFLSFFEVQTLKAACVVLLRTDRNGLKISMGSSDWGSFSTLLNLTPCDSIYGRMPRI